MFSAETLYFLVMVLITAVINGVGLYMIAESFIINGGYIVLAECVALMVLTIL